jgi:hypothetical protein
MQLGMQMNATALEVHSNFSLKQQLIHRDPTNVVLSHYGSGSSVPPQQQQQQQQQSEKQPFEPSPTLSTGNNVQHGFNSYPFLGAASPFSFGNTAQQLDNNRNNRFGNSVQQHQHMQHGVNSNPFLGAASPFSFGNTAQQLDNNRFGTSVLSQQQQQQQHQQQPQFQQSPVFFSSQQQSEQQSQFEPSPITFPATTNVLSQQLQGRTGNNVQQAVRYNPFRANGQQQDALSTFGNNVQQQYCSSNVDVHNYRFGNSVQQQQQQQHKPFFGP